MHAKSAAEIGSKRWMHGTRRFMQVLVSELLPNSVREGQSSHAVEATSDGGDPGSVSV